MRISKNLTKQLKLDEGFRGVIYKDSLGFDTIGYGTKLPLSENECNIIMQTRISSNKSYVLDGKDDRYFYAKDGGLYPKQNISKKEAEALLKHRLKKKADELKERLSYQYPNINQDNEVICEVLLNMSYQLGVNGLFKFEKMLTALNKSDYKEVVEQMRDSRWHSQTPNRVNSLIYQIESLNSSGDDVSKYRGLQGF